MMTIVLGGPPASLEVHVSRNSGFTCTLQAFNAAGNPVNYPSGTTITIVLNSGTWTATVSGNAATFNRTDVQVNATIAWGSKQTASLFYQNGTDKLLWAKGHLVVDS